MRGFLWSLGLVFALQGNPSNKALAAIDPVGPEKVVARLHGGLKIRYEGPDAQREARFVDAIDRLEYGKDKEEALTDLFELSKQSWSSPMKTTEMRGEVFQQLLRFGSKDARVQEAFVANLRDFAQPRLFLFMQEFDRLLLDGSDALLAAVAVEFSRRIDLEPMTAFESETLAESLDQLLLGLRAHRPGVMVAITLGLIKDRAAFEKLRSVATEFSNKTVQRSALSILASLTNLDAETVQVATRLFETETDPTLKAAAAGLIVMHGRSYEEIQLAKKYLLQLAFQPLAPKREVAQREVQALSSQFARVALNRAVTARHIRLPFWTRVKLAKKSSVELCQLLFGRG